MLIKYFPVTHLTHISSTEDVMPSFILTQQKWIHANMKTRRQTAEVENADVTENPVRLQLWSPTPVNTGGTFDDTSLFDEVKL